MWRFSAIHLRLTVVSSRSRRARATTFRAGPHSQAHDRCPRIVEATLLAQLESLHKSWYRVNLDTNWRGFNDVLRTEA